MQILHQILRMSIWHQGNQIPNRKIPNSNTNNIYAKKTETHRIISFKILYLLIESSLFKVAL